MLLFCLSYTILFLCAKYGSKIDIESSNSIYMYDKNKKVFMRAITEQKNGLN